MRMSSLPIITIHNLTVDECAERCTRESTFECKSFDVDNKLPGCRLFNNSHEDPFIHLLPSTYIDHYKSSYSRRFHRLPNHIVTISHDRKIPGITVEACARRCVFEISFKCHGFDYEVQLKNCWLTSKTPSEVDGVIIQYGTDYYQRIFDGPFENFVNFGYGKLRPLEGIHIYNKIMIGVSLEHCAQLCLAETAFSCASFDYEFVDKSCHMSQYIAANVHGLQNEYSEDVRTMHYELKDEYLSRFYPTPYAAITGHNDKTISRITPSNCARKCLMERDFICRSFDYQIQDGKCLLSSRAGSDVGGLGSYGHAQVHHFEMKPSLECGGIFTTANGDFASPNWPRNYQHNLNCTWKIHVAQFKVIRLNIIHFNLGHSTSQPCDDVNDRLVIVEEYRQQTNSLCVQHDVDTYISKTNKVNVNFLTNSKSDAPGFKIFYNDDWPCGSILSENNGQLASPRWPNAYPPFSSCDWTIKAPKSCTIYLSFSSVELEQHMKTDCATAYDKIELYDGKISNDSRIATFCGKISSVSYTSSSQVFYVKFMSDDRVQNRGFHAAYTFKCPKTTTEEQTTKYVTNNPTTSQEVDTWKTVPSASPLTEVTSTVLSTADNIAVSDDTPVKVYHFNSSHMSLLAMFVEPKLRRSRLEQDDHPMVINTTQVTENVAVTQMDNDLTSTNVRLWHTVVILIIVFIVVAVIVILMLLIMCRHYRNKLPKRECLTNAEESENLYSQDKNLNDASDKGSTETLTCSLPRASPVDAQPDVMFTNPIYDKRHMTSSSTLASTTFTEYNV